MRNKGFALIEVIIVLLILSLSIALVTPSLSRFSSKAELKTVAKRVSAILRYCRSEAVNKVQIYQIVFDSDLREVRVQRMESSGGNEENEKQEGVASEKIYPLPKGILMKEVEIPSPWYPSDPDLHLPTIEFYPNGGSNGGSILFNSEGGGGYRVKVHFLTGMVEIEKV